jgi:glyoxylase-like metal-dependent hydrolase (beta-lactamase superfamily II)
VTAAVPAIDLVRTDGRFELDGGTWEVTNNIWLVGDDREVLVIDAAHDYRAVVDAVDGRRVRAIVLTHGHNDHINAAVALREHVDAPVHLHPADRMLWDVVYPEDAPDRQLADGDGLEVAGARLAVLHTPGHSPGSCSFYLAAAAPPAVPVVFTGDTLFSGGPGATGRSYSDEPTILRSIARRLLTLPDATEVRTGHGPSTTVGSEAPMVGQLLDSRGLTTNGPPAA